MKSQNKMNQKMHQKSMKQQDIIELILEDHKPLKTLIKVLKNSDDYSLKDRQIAFEEFALLLTAHAYPEEEVLYTQMKLNAETREEAFEGDVEHGLADQMVEEVKATIEDADLWSARVKVLAEVVEHHIEEEEEELLPSYRKHSDLEERVELGQKFLAQKMDILASGGKDIVPEEKKQPEVQPRH